MSSTAIVVNINAKGTVTGLNQVDDGLKRLRQSAAQTQAAITKSYKINFDGSKFNAVSSMVTKANASLNKLNPSFQKISKSAATAAQEINTKFNPSLSGITTAIGGLQNILVGGIIGTAVVRGIGAAVDKSVELENALIGVTTVAKSFGQDTDAVKRAVVDFTKDGLVSATESALAFKQILSTGTDLQTAIKLMNGLKDAAAFNRQSFYSLGEAVVATTEGIKNGNSVRADAVGITKNLSVLDQEYADAVGKSAKNLSDVEKVQARVNGFIRESAVFSGDAIKATDTYSGSTARLGKSFDTLLAKMGDFITKSGLVRGGINLLAKGFDLLAKGEAFSKTSDEKLAMLNKRLVELSDTAKSETGVYKKYAEEQAASIKRQIDAIEDSIYYSQLSNEESAKTVQAKRAEKDATAALSKTINEAAKERAKALKALEKKYELGGGLNSTEKLKAQFDKEIELAQGNFNLRYAIVKDYYKKLEEVQDKDKAKQIKDANELAQLKKRITSDSLIGGANGSTAESTEGLTAEQKATAQQNRRIGQGVGVLNNVAAGADGAKALVSSVASMGLDALVPGLGTAAKPLLDAFTQGPDAVKAMVKDFAKALPDIIVGFIEAIPVFIEELANQLPVIIEKLAEKLPDLIAKLVAAAPRVILALVTAMPKVAIKFAGELIKNLPKIVSEAARAIFNAISKALSKLTGGLVGKGKNGSGVVGSVTKGVKDLGKALGFANGGVAKVAGGGAPFTDSVNSKVQSGEMWVDHSLTNKMDKFFNGNGGNGNAEIHSVLNKIVELLGQPMTVESEAKVHDDAFAKIFLRLNRNNKRLGFV